jgi:cell division protein FtsN
MVAKTTRPKRRARAGASRRKERQSAIWLGLGIGLTFGLVVAYLIYLNLVKTPPQATAPSTPQTTPRQASKTPPKKEPAIPVNESKYDFYNILPNQTVDAPTDDYRDKQKSRLGMLPLSKPAASGNAFSLQAGSFRRQQDADHRKAKLALLGIEARVEKVRLNDGYTHRVLIGPYASIEKTNRIKTQLHSQNIPTMLVNVGK